MIDTYTSAKLVRWTIKELSPALSRAYKRPKEPAPKFEAIAPLGSIVRASTIEELKRRADLSGGR